VSEKSFLSFFTTSFALSLLGLLGAGYLGYLENDNGSQIVEFIFISLVLALLEITISFDNAIVNAAVLKNMTKRWQKRFLTWGMLIAVFGMRLVFPIVIVCVAAKLGPLDAVRLALFDQNRYADVMLSVHDEVAAFGGAFLALVSLSFFFNREKEKHWLGFIERHLAKLGGLRSVEIAFLLGALWLFSDTLDDARAYPVFKAGIAGILTFLGVKLLGDVLSIPESGKRSMARQSLGLFLYLEVLDASFSFDGVVAAFAVTVNPFLIAIGLGIGALFVRSFTIVMVEKGTLQTFKYLEHGAFWAIGALAAMMFLGIHVHLPEIATGGVSLAVIGAAFLHSLAEMKKERG
jgi:hypothetical protein